MPKIGATIFSDITLTDEQTTQLNELEQNVQTLIDNKAGIEEIKAAYHEFVAVCFDFYQYEKAVTALNFLKENQKDDSDSDKGLLHRRFGVLAFGRKDFETADKEFKAGLELAETAEDAELIARTLCDLGNIATVNEDLESAIELYEEAIEINEQNEIDAATPYFNLGLVYTEVQNLSEAIDCFESALDIYKEENKIEQQKQMYLQLGALYFAQEDLKSALLKYHYATELQEENSEELGKTYISIVSVLLKMNKHSKAVEYYEKALPILIPFGDIELQSEHYFQIANLYNNYLDNYEKAIYYYGQALEVAKTDNENDEWRALMIAKLEDSIEVNQALLSKKNKRKSKKPGFFKKLFGK